MPNVSRTRRYNSAFVNVRVRTEEDMGDECGICLRSWCMEDICCRTSSQTNCCFQFLCSSCTVKMSLRCTCDENCPNVIYICPFCRNISKSEPVTLFLGAKRVCKKCRDRDNDNDNDNDNEQIVESPEEEEA